ncbi:CDP-glycerol glycerophosphotransferase family protein [Dellaglioa algida]|uniref:CDP-glycerol glycerophosphotransferase family protein n=1 Tax=Dellaglioa algida TaxID=105612 RepID=UPI000BDC3394|nr:CDP-glycerol glycerophosphotransferase family protein [Dellaglioa algida]MDK1718442.1 CDP-glycerol glycerophosphotransferase family protein [Dellaglioa algida]MDK1728804.1 CDP-glycerol glycerophosphotransferase family protein [Dellaglioa algida]MDK1729466.1 CDP-glycerol glycerophosphotransferase family protein [Dellaglioa algida]MDK1736505.1 CDP-glycerol glycerophosphotransferase family protein [Dellaglioa algida]MDK1737559.1 CDP-glycerol glycerophosphotransferase family protein [Dellaglioa
MNEKKLSIVVPIYNISNYLEECLSSFLVQGIDNYEVIMVNDGSTDNSGEIAKRYEDKYENYKLLDQKNGGLGYARNSGAAAATGDYLTFVDSDDIIPDNSYEKMLNIIEKSHSDFIIGNVVRFNSRKSYGSVLHKRIFREDMVGTNIHDTPELINDTTAWNKVFNINFWRENDFKFPEGMLYEDIPVSIPAHAMAKKVDILTDITYKWRARDAGDSSITQQRSSVDNFSDRMKAINSVRQFFAKQNISQSLNDIFDYKNFQFDFPLYMYLMNDVDEDYQAIFFSTIQEYFPKISKEVFLKIALKNRIQYQLIVENKIEEFKDSVRQLKLSKYKPHKSEQGYSYNYPYKEVLAPNDRYVSKEEFRVNMDIEEAYWDNDVFKLSWTTFLWGISEKHKKDISVSVALVNSDDTQEIEISNPVSIKFNPMMTLRKSSFSKKHKMPYLKDNYNYSKFELTLPIKDLMPQMHPNKSYYLSVKYNINGVEKNAILNSPKKGLSTKPHYQLMDDYVVTPSYNIKWELEFKKSAAPVVIEAVNKTNNGIEFTGRCVANRKKLFAEDSSRNRIFETDMLSDDNGNFKATITKEQISELDFSKLYIYSDSENPVSLDPKLINRVYGISDKQLSIFNTLEGGLVLSIDQPQFIVEKVEAIKKSFSINIMYLDTANAIVSKDSAELVFTGEKDNFIIKANELKTDGLTKILTFIFDPNTVFKTFDNSFSVTISVNNNEEELYVFRKTLDELRIKDSKRQYIIKYSFNSSTIFLNIKQSWGVLDNSPRKQMILAKLVYPLMRLLPIQKKTAVYESFWGREFSDNPKAILEYVQANRPDIKNVVFVKNVLKDFSDVNAKVYRKNSFMYFYTLARGKYFFNNVNFPNHYDKRKNAVEVQTMHGTPLKKLGFDNPGEIKDSAREGFIERNSRWDYLTVPSDYVADIAKSAYLFDKTFLNVGYPRNDSLFIPTTQNEKNDILKKYGLPLDKKIIFYAPTWRSKGKYAMPIDLNELKEQFSDEYVFVIKLHHFSIPSYSLEGLEDFAIDLSNNSDIRDLYKVSDMMITDYSSVMFDYALLRKPMLFYAYDYDNYKDNLRELYFDFEEEAPGAFIRNTDALIGEINDIDRYFDKYKNKIETFDEKFIQYDKGTASEQVVKRIIK